MVSTEQSIESRLKQWPRFEAKRRQLELSIVQQKSRLNELKDKLSDDGILGSLIVVYDDKLLMPHGSDTTDRTGNLVASVTDKVNMLRLKLTDTEADLALVMQEIQELQDTVDQLSRHHRDVLVMFYRDRVFWTNICVKMRLSKTTMYRMMEEGIKAIDGHGDMDLFRGNYEPVATEWE